MTKHIMVTIKMKKNSAKSSHENGCKQSGGQNCNMKDCPYDSNVKPKIPREKAL